MYVGWDDARKTWALRTRGITVEGQLQGSHWYDGVEQYTYAYVDSKGIRREHTTSSGGGERAEITYNPATPEIGRRDAGCHR